MKTLLILRHAKSSWDDPAMADHERPLNTRGRMAAPQIARLLRDEGLLPHHILCSTAVRARQTVELLAEESGYSGPVEYREDLYLASPWRCLAALGELPVACATAMLVGHNPGLEELLQGLTGEEEHLPTAALAQVQLDVAEWGELSTQTRAALVNLWRPKELHD